MRATPGSYFVRVAVSRNGRMRASVVGRWAKRGKNDELVDPSAASRRQIEGWLALYLPPGVPSRR